MMFPHINTRAPIVIRILLILPLLLPTISLSLTLKVSVLFSDDFNDGNDDGWGPKIGTWVVVGGEYTALGSSGTPMSQVPVGPVSDFILEGDLKITQEGAAQVAVRLQSLSSTIDRSKIGDGVLLVIFPGGNSIYWHVIRNGVGGPRDIQPLGTRVDENHPLKIKVKVQGNTYQAYANGVLANTLIDGTFSSGYVALGVNLNYPTPTRWDNILISSPSTTSRIALALVSGTEGQLRIGEERQIKLEIINFYNYSVTYTVRAISDAVQFIGSSEIPIMIEPLSSTPVTFYYRATESGTKIILVKVYQDFAIISQSSYTISISPSPSFWEVQPPWYIYVFISAIVSVIFGYFIKGVIDRLRGKSNEQKTHSFLPVSP